MNSAEILNWIFKQIYTYANVSILTYLILVVDKGLFHYKVNAVKNITNFKGSKKFNNYKRILNFFYRPPEKDQDREWLRKCEKSTSVTVTDRYWPKFMYVL